MKIAPEYKVNMVKEFTYFRFDLWIMTLIFTLVIAFFKTGILLVFSKMKALEIICLFWTSLTACLGGKPASTSIDSRKSYKMTVFISLLSGLIIWIAYRSYLTAELSVIINRNPFDSLEELSKSNWRLILASKSHTATKLILEAKPGTSNHKVNQNNVDENSIVQSKDERIEILLNEPNTAAFCYNGYVITSEAFRNCKVGNTIQTLMKLQRKCNFNYRLKKSLAQELGTCQLVWLRTLRTRYSWIEFLSNFQKMPKCTK